VVVVGLVESDVVFGVNNEVRSVNVVALENHIEDFWLMHSALLHEVYYFILDHYGMIDVIIELDLQFILQLAGLCEELLVFDGIREVLVVLCEKVEFANVCPGVESVTHGVLSPDSDVFATAQQEELVDLSFQVLPVEHVGKPGESVAQIEDHGGDLPGPGEGVHEEKVVGQGDEGVVHHVGVLQVHCAVFYVIARVQKELTIAVEFKSLRWLVDFVCSLQILSGTLSKLSLCCPNDFVEVLDLTEAALLLLNKASLVHR